MDFCNCYYLVCSSVLHVQFCKMATLKAFLTSLMVFFFSPFLQTVLRSLHLPKNNSLYVLTPDIAPSASTSQSRYVCIVSSCASLAQIVLLKTGPKLKGWTCILSDFYTSERSIFLHQVTNVSHLQTVKFVFS